MIWSDWIVVAQPLTLTFTDTQTNTSERVYIETLFHAQSNFIHTSMWKFQTNLMSTVVFVCLSSIYQRNFCFCKNWEYECDCVFVFVLQCIICFYKHRVSYVILMITYVHCIYWMGHFFIFVHLLIFLRAIESTQKYSTNKVSTWRLSERKEEEVARNQTKTTC